MRQRVLLRFGVLWPNNCVFWCHWLQVTAVIDQKRMICKQIDQIVKVVRQGSTVLNDDAAILPICKVVFR